jgi:hypothetical protein
LNPYPRKGEADLPSALLFHLKQSLKTKIVWLKPPKSNPKNLKLIKHVKTLTLKRLVTSLVNKLISTTNPKYLSKTSSQVMMNSSNLRANQSKTLNIPSLFKCLLGLPATIPKRKGSLMKTTNPTILRVVKKWMMWDAKLRRFKLS